MNVQKMSGPNLLLEKFGSVRQNLLNLFRLRVELGSLVQQESRPLLFLDRSQTDDGRGCFVRGEPLALGNCHISYVSCTRTARGEEASKPRPGPAHLLCLHTRGGHFALLFFPCQGKKWKS